MFNDILIATTNEYKKQKLTWIVERYFKKVHYLDDLDLNLVVNESGNSFKRNACIKAIEYSKHCRDFVISTDGGVLIPALGNTWNGLYTRRFAGEDVSDFERIKKLLEVAKPLKGAERKVVWKEAVAIGKAGKVLFSKEALGVAGILQENFDPTKYIKGIWVCSLWFFPQYNKSFFDLTIKERQKVEVSWKKLKDATDQFLQNHFFFLLKNKAA